MWMNPGKMTASAESERSWLPPDPSKSINRVWYGDPGIEIAELVRPQSCRVAMRPPQARTGLPTDAVKLIRMHVVVSELPAYVAVSEVGNGTVAHSVFPVPR